MAKVSDIKAQKRRQDRLSIYFDGTYRLSLSQNQLVDAGLRIGDDLSEAEINKLESESDFGKALDRAYNFLSYRGRSRKEVTDYLRRKQYDDDMAMKILGRLEESGAINDATFARDWVESRQLVSPRSRRQLESELRAKGIDRDLIEEALESAGDETRVLADLITDRRLLQRYDSEQKLIQYLSGKGFSYQTIKAALQQLSDRSE